MPESVSPTIGSQILYGLLSKELGFGVSPPRQQIATEAEKLAARKYEDEQARAKEAMNTMSIVADYDRAVREAEAKSPLTEEIVRSNFGAFMPNSAVTGAEGEKSTYGTSPEPVLALALAPVPL